MKNTIQPLQKSLLALTIASSAATGDVQAEDTDFGIEEVVVTAQKRAQSAQDIGVAVAAISGDALREQGINRGDDLAKVIPNVSVQNIGGGGLPVVIVRGIGLQNFRVNDSPTTSFYVDEVYQTSIASVEFSMFDMERVEVLKGPQGGLYGRNTIGGAVQVISARPEVGEGHNGYVNLSYGEHNTREAEAAAAFPLSDSSAVRVAARWERSGDTDYESTTGNIEYGETDRWAARAQLRIAPSDELDLLFKVHGGADRSELPLPRSVGLYNDIGTGAAFGAPNVSLGLLSGLLGAGSAGLCQSILDGNGSNSSSCATLSGQTPADYGQGNDNLFESSAGDLLPVLDSEWAGISAIATWQTGDYTLTSITAYDTINYHRLIDADATPVEFQNIDYRTGIDFWAQEFRLAYDSGNEVNWIVGVNYSEDKLDESTLLMGGDSVLPIFFGGATSSPQDYQQDTEAFAIYGHAEWQFAETLKFIGELRYTHEEKSFAGGQLFGFADGSTAPFVATEDDTRFEALSGKLGLDWTPTENTLFYASISQGFKTGGFFGGFAVNVEELAPFDEETILAYEMGVKSDWLDNRLRANASLFYYDRQDVQQNAKSASGSNVSIARLTNIGDVETRGAEVDLTWLPLENLTLQLSLGYTDAEIADSDFVVSSVLPLIGNASLEGRNVPNYSKFSGNFLGRYEHPISETLLASAQLEYSYRSERDLSLITNSTLEDPLFKEPGYSLINLRLGLGDADDLWRITAFVENLADEEYRTESRSDGLYGMRELYGPSRTWGISFTRNWD